MCIYVCIYMYISHFSVVFVRAFVSPGRLTSHRLSILHTAGLQAHQRTVVLKVSETAVKTTAHF